MSDRPDRAPVFPQSEPNFIESHQLTLEAGRTKILECYGRTFVCVSAAAGFQMSYNNGRYFDVRNGVEWSLDQDQRFNLLKFKSEAAQTIDLLIGNFFYHENVVTPVFSLAETLAKGSAQTIAAGQTIVLTGIGGAGLGNRKALIVTNRDAALDLDVLDSANVQMHTIFYRQAHVFETSSLVKLKNNNPLAMDIRVMEIFYLA
jgi:hypothetical protein